MHDWRSRAWYQVGLLEQALQGAGVPAGDPEAERRRDVWSAIDRFSAPQHKEPQFAQLEAATRVELGLLRYALASPPMRELVLSGERPELPQPSADFRDWRSRAPYQVQALAVTVGADDPEAGRRARLWLAIERFDWPQVKEQQFAHLEHATHAEVGLIHYLCGHSAGAHELILRPRGAAAAAAKAAEEKPGPEPEPGEEPFDPLGGIGDVPEEPYEGPPAAILRKDAETLWNQLQSQAGDKLKAVDTARRLKAVVELLFKNPEGAEDLKAIEALIGMPASEVLDHKLENRLG